MSDDFDAEPIRGLPGWLPPGERILWQGEPRWQALARRAFHTWKVAAYCAILLVWRLIVTLYDGGGVPAAAAAALSVLPFAVAGIGILYVLALAFARTTVFTITNRRVAIRFGVAFPTTFNIPFRVIGGADLRSYADGTGDIALRVVGPDRIAYLHLWPFARPWRFSPAEPMLRCISRADEVAALLSKALASYGFEEAHKSGATTRQTGMSRAGIERAAAAA